VNFIHCIIHREALALCDLEPKLHSVLQEAVKVVNSVKARPLNSCLFAVLCEEIHADHKSLLLHSEVRWLSGGKVLKWLVELKKEVRIFLHDSGSRLYQHFLDKKWFALKPHVLTRLTNLENNFKNRFPDLTLQQHEWMWNSFAVAIGEKISSLSIKAKESVMELSCDTSLKIKFEALSLPVKNTWKTQTIHWGVTGTTYLCEKTFSAMAAIKSKNCNRLQLESDLWVAVSMIQPRMSHLVSNMQACPSHWVTTVSHFCSLSVSMVSLGGVGL
jgi:hypothetical protein